MQVQSLLSSKCSERQLILKSQHSASLSLTRTLPAHTNRNSQGVSTSLSKSLATESHVDLISKARRGMVVAAAARNVVVAADASEEAIAVFDYALNNLYRPGDRLHVVHVVPDVTSAKSSTTGFFSLASYESADVELEGECIWQQAEEFIQGTMIQKAKAQGVDVNVVLVKEGKHHIGKAVCREAEALHAEPLVLASHNKGYFETMFLGSISKFCAKHCKRPVLLLHPDHSPLTY